MRTGSGFFVNAGGWIATDAAFARGCTRLESSRGGLIGAVLADTDAPVALLHAPGASPPATLSFRASGARLGEDVAFVGFLQDSTAGDAASAAIGMVSATTTPDGDTRYLRLSQEVPRGVAGGPVIARGGAVIALAATGIDGSSGFAISAAQAIGLLRRNGIVFSFGTDDTSRDFSRHIATASTATVRLDCYGDGPADGADPGQDPAVQALAEGGTFTVEPGRDVLGFDFAILRDTSAAACRAACANDDRCVALTYNKRNEICFLKEDAQVVVPASIAIAAFRPELADRLTRADFTLRGNTNAPGGDYQRIRNGDFPDCYVRCATDARCRAFSYEWSQKICLLKDRVIQEQPAQGVDFGRR